MNLAVGEIELHHAHVAVAAHVGHLVIHEHLVDGVAELVRALPLGRTVMVSVEGEKHLIVVLGQFVPNLLTKVGAQGGDAVTLNINELVGVKDRRGRLVTIEDSLRPLERLGVRGPRKVENEELRAIDIYEVCFVSTTRITLDEGGVFRGAFGAKVVLVNRVVGREAFFFGGAPDVVVTG